MASLTIPRPKHPTGIWNWITTIDHKKIGILYGVTAFLLFLSGGLEALVMRIQLARPGQELVSPEDRLRRLWRLPEIQGAKPLYLYSLLYMALLFLAIIIDSLVKI